MVVYTEQYKPLVEKILPSKFIFILLHRQKERNNEQEERKENEEDDFIRSVIHSNGTDPNVSIGTVIQ